MKSKAEKFEIAKNILLALAVVGVAVLAPNALVLFGGKFKTKKEYTPEQIRKSIARLRKRGLVMQGEHNGKTTVHLTKEGQRQVLGYKLDDMRIKPQKHWDGKWRVVVFDIPEKYKYARNVFASKLKELGFHQLQRSVWVCPHPCEEEIAFLREVYEIGPFVRTLTVEKMDIEADLLSKFKL